MPRLVTRLVGGVFSLAFAFGALTSPYPLIQVGCGLALISLIAAVTIVGTASEAVLARLTGCVVSLMVVAFVTLMVGTHVLGGGAANGVAEGGRYLLGSHGRYIAVSRGQYYFVAAIELAVFSLFPLGVALVALTSERRRAATDAGSAEERGRRTSA